MPMNNGVRSIVRGWMMLGAVLLWGAISPANADMNWNAVFPNGLVDAQGQHVSTDTLNGKMVFLYFASSTCGPCHFFCPKLIEFRNRYKDQIEVVFVSQDASEQAQLKYMQDSKMPWPAVKWHDYKLEDGNELRGLMSKYQGWGTPSVAVLSDSGELESKERADWVPQEIELLPEEHMKILDAEVEKIDVAYVQREAKSERTVLNDEQVHRRIESDRQLYQARITQLKTLYRDSLDFKALNSPPTWMDLLFDYYQFKRQAKLTPAQG